MATQLAAMMPKQPPEEVVGLRPQTSPFQVFFSLRSKQVKTLIWGLLKASKRLL